MTNILRIKLTHLAHYAGYDPAKIGDAVLEYLGFRVDRHTVKNLAIVYNLDGKIEFMG